MGPNENKISVSPPGGEADLWTKQLVIEKWISDRVAIRFIAWLDGGGRILGRSLIT